MRSSYLRFGTAVFALLFGVLSLQAQENKETPKKKKSENAPAAQHQAPQRQERQEQQHPPAAIERPQRQEPQHQVPQRQEPQHQEPSQPQVHQPPVRQEQPQHMPGQQPSHQPAQGNRPGIYQPSQASPNRPVDRGGFGGSRPGAASPAPAPRVVRTSNGGMVQRNAAGRVTVVRTPSGASIYHAPTGVRRVEVVRPGGTVVVARAPGNGYVQRPVVVNNVTIVKRTYLVAGVPRVRVYRPMTYGGVVLNVYTPVRYYRPAYYRYVYAPWGRPVVYSWGWAGSPWYGYYGGYFTPYPVYASPALWLTDYFLAATLEEAYRERMADAAAQQNAYAQGGQVPMSPEVKQAIADEVRRQIDQERAEQAANGNYASNGAPPMFADGASHVFVAHSALEVNSNAGPCFLSEGDVLQLNGVPPMNASAASVHVLASHGQDCPRGAVASVQIEDLQEMQNQMRATIDRGLGDLQTRQGQGGLPPLPPGSSGTIDTPLAAQAQPDPGVSAQLTQVTQDADRAEQDVIAQSQAPAGASGPVTISLGQSVDEVRSIQGDPDKIVDLGAKKIYVYKDLKITFTDGKVSDVQ